MSCTQGYRLRKELKKTFVRLIDCGSHGAQRESDLVVAEKLRQSMTTVLPMRDGDLGGGRVLLSTAVLLAAGKSVSGLNLL